MFLIQSFGKHFSKHNGVQAKGEDFRAKSCKLFPRYRGYVIDISCFEKGWRTLMTSMFIAGKETHEPIIEKARVRREFRMLQENLRGCQG